MSPQPRACAFDQGSLADWDSRPRSNPVGRGLRRAPRTISWACIPKWNTHPRWRVPWWCLALEWLWPSPACFLPIFGELWAPERAPLRPIGWWLAVLAAIASAVCFLAGLRMVGHRRGARSRKRRKSFTRAGTRRARSPRSSRRSKTSRT